MTVRIVNYICSCSLLVWCVLAVAAQETLPELVRRVKPSAVAIETFNQKGERLARGSGFFVTADRIVTNLHVIENAGRVEVRLASGKSYSASGVLATDGEGDLALLQIAVPQQERAAPLTIVQNAPQEGESIVVIGNPFGLEGSVSNGIVSAVRDISGYGKTIQITAPISPGSSGSPVVNMNGEVVGVATLQAAEGQSLNFAVPAERITNLKIGEVRTFVNLNAEVGRNKRAAAEREFATGLGVLSRDDYARAAVYFERAVAADPNYPEAWYQLGFCYGMLKRHADALKASKQAARLRPDWTGSYINIGASSFALGQYKEAAEAYRNAARLDAYNADVQYALGLTLNKLNRPDEETLAYKRAVEIKADFALAWEKLGATYFRQKKFQPALTAFEQLKLLTGDAKAYNFAGESLYELGKFEESIESFNFALGVKPDFERARYNLGRAYVKLERPEQAVAQYEILRDSRSDWADKLYVVIYP